MILLLYLVLDKFTSRVSSFIVFLSIGSLIALMAGLRSSSVDRDYLPYVDYFQSIKDFSFYFHNSYWTYAEPFYYFIPLFFKSISNGYFIELTFLLFAILGVCFKLRGLYFLTPLWCLSLLLYYTNFYFLHEMTQIRIGVATGLFLIAIKYYVKEYNVKSFITILIAIMFHYTSILMLVLFLLKRDTIKLSNYFIVIGISIICYFLHVNSIVLISKIASIPKILVYIDLMSKGYHSEINVFNVMLLFNLMITLLLSYKINMIQELNKNAIVLLKLNLISIILFIALYSFPVAAFRLSELFGVVQIVLFTFLFYIFKEKWFSYLIIIIYSFLFFYMNLYRNNVLSDYKLIF